MQGILTRLQRRCYFTPLNEESRTAMWEFWQELTAEENCPVEPRDLETKVCPWRGAEKRFLLFSTVEYP